MKTMDGFGAGDGSEGSGNAKTLPVQLDTLRDGGWLPIECYGVLGDGRSVVLLGADGSVDWWCLPGLADAPIFDALLDGERGGRFALTPHGAAEGEITVRRRYLPDSNVLEHTYTSAAAELRATWSLNGGIAGRLPWSELAIRLEMLRGEMTLGLVAVPGRRPGDATSWREATPSGQVLHLDGVMLAFRCSEPVEIDREDDEGLEGRLRLREGARAVAALIGGAGGPLVLPPFEEIDRRIDRTTEAWREWVRSRDISPPYREAVRRSALALKMLLYAPTGAIAAAATNGLPERIGGDKNYDYRYAWVRDAALTIKAFMRIGAIEETQAAFAWLIGTIARHGDIRVMYTLEGDITPEPKELDLRGWRDSRPLHRGNPARTQLQLGVYGDVLGTAALLIEAGHVMDLATRTLLAHLADRCADLWMAHDCGFWELQDKQHYTSSKFGCWAALDRAVWLAERGQIDVSRADRWRRQRDRIADWIETEAWSEAKGAYVMYPGSDRLDTACLLAVRLGYPNRTRLHATVRRMDAELSAGPLVYRYSGAEREEGTFLACAFWIVQSLAQFGETVRAQSRMQAVLAATGHNLGLLSEEMLPASPTMLGNIPQALSHLGLILAADALPEEVSGP